ncbi:hypothetical protein L6773_18490 [Rhodohalobacter sp. WB101]|uniref:Uncharacterized protein n=1 Tax=Rhodohalobacter sulfatireducens TaxID=2911366 RepID=A0ABS9KI84_9BACT|nr:hypothetical protein [Rhodohalobacter sulfatireducens]
MASTKKDIKNTLLLLTKNPEGPSVNLFQKQLDDLGLRKQEMEDEIEFCKKERNRLKDHQLLDDESYKSLLNEFISLWEESSKFERIELV